MVLARGFFVISILAVLSSASAGFISPPPHSAPGYAPQQEHGQEQGQPLAPERYFGPSQFA
ncbi:hypothetical protein [Aquabacter cavernae]|uniref:hypothetical protein n=1 Tax=Aquabacter cavernae TaxID=2496029 RepID=UPI000F8DBAEF|nr:hypothetical protein [Aquabacter cavernae]